MNSLTNFLSIVLLLFMAACGEDDYTSSGPSSSSSTEQSSSVAAGNIEGMCTTSYSGGSVRAIYKGSQAAIDTYKDSCNDESQSWSDSVDTSCTTNDACKGESAGLLYCSCAPDTGGVGVCLESQTVASDCSL